MTSASLVLAVLIAAGPAAKPASSPKGSAAGASATERELRRRALTITDETMNTLPEIHVAGGKATVVTFQTDIADGGILLGSADALFYPIAQASRMAILSPKSDLKAPVSVNVQLKDGTILTFQALSSRTDVDAQVDVMLDLKHRASADSASTLRATIGSLRNQLDECRATAGDAGAQKLAALLLTQNLESPQAFDRRPLRGIEKQSRLLVEAKWAYRLLGLTYIIVSVENRDPEKPWVFDRAEITVSGGREKQDLKVAATAAEFSSLAPDQAGRVVISFATPSNGASQKVVVSLYERDGGRVVSLPAMEI